MFVYHMAGSKTRVPTQEAWVEALRLGLHRPKPPEWWLDSQEREEHRTRQQASIIWGTHYNVQRRAMIWEQAPLSDYIALGYYEG